MKKTILAPAVALSLGLTGSLGAIAAPAFAAESETQQTGIVTFDKTELTVEEAKNHEIRGEFKGKPGDKLEYTFTKDGAKDPLIAGSEKIKNGADASSISLDPDSENPAGTYTFSYTFNGEKRDPITITVTDPNADEDNEEQPGEGDVGTPDKGSAKISTNKITLSEAQEKGIEVSYTGGKPKDDVIFWLDKVDIDKDYIKFHKSDSAKVDENGNARASFKLDYEGIQPEELDGEWEIVVLLAPADGGNDATVATLPLTVVADENDSEEEEAPAKDPALNLSEKKVKAVDFVNEEKGLKAVVSNLEPGTEVKFNVAGTSGNAKNVRPFKQTVKADKDGNAVFSIKGISEDNPSAYLGKYTVTAEFDDQKLEDSFEVVSGKGGKSDSEDAGSGGGSVSGGASDNVSGSTTSGSSGTLPRTGQGLGGLAAGAALLTVGGAAVLLTRRTRKA